MCVKYVKQHMLYKGISAAVQSAVYEGMKVEAMPFFPLCMY